MVVHEQFQEWLDELVEESGVGQEVLGEVLARTSLRAPAETSRVEISAGNPTARRPIDQRAIPQGTVSKAVKALRDKGLLEDGEKVLRGRDGRTLSPLRLGRGFAIAGVKVEHLAGQPRLVTTALVGLDGSRVLSAQAAMVPDAGGDRWRHVAQLVRDQVTALKHNCDKDRANHGLAPLQMFGVGIEVGAPVQDGKVMPLLDGAGEPAADLATLVRQMLDEAPEFRSVPVVVENDVNALAVLAIHEDHEDHEDHYTESDLVVVGVFDEGVGGGLVMDARLRRGGNGKAMEVGHLAVGFPPGKEPAPQNARGNHRPAATGNPGAAAGFDAPCSCGHFGHVDTLATPRRIRDELGAASFEEVCSTDARDPDFDRIYGVLSRSGSALGRALAHVSNTVNPNMVIVYLPEALAKPGPATAGAAYLTGMRKEATGAFAASGQPEYITVRPLPAGTGGALLGAKAAAVCVLESFIEHALRLDGCSSGLRRASTGSRVPAA
jgi:predicted NBD/HSP70 family sugar kinase